MQSAANSVNTNPRGKQQTPICCEQSHPEAIAKCQPLASEILEIKNKPCRFMLDSARTRTVDNSLVVFVMLTSSSQFEEFTQFSSVNAGLISTRNCQSYRQSVD